MKLINLNEQELQELKDNLMKFVERISNGYCTSEAVILPEIVKILLGYPAWPSADYIGEIKTEL